MMMTMRKIDIARTRLPSAEKPPMRKIIGSLFQSLHGVIQAGGPEEDQPDQDISIQIAALTPSPGVKPAHSMATRIVCS